MLVTDNIGEMLIGVAYELSISGIPVGLAIYGSSLSLNTYMR